jgi:hypothetical protein
MRFSLGKRLELHHAQGFGDARFDLIRRGFCIRRPNATFSNTVMCGKRA